MNEYRHILEYQLYSLYLTLIVVIVGPGLQVVCTEGGIDKTCFCFKFIRLLVTHISGIFITCISKDIDTFFVPAGFLAPKKFFASHASLLSLTFLIFEGFFSPARGT